MPHAALTLALSLIVAPPALDAPRFERGDPGALVCRVLSAEEITKDAEGALIEVVVTNPGERHAEPLLFLFTPAGRGAPPAVEVARVEFPHHGRAGNAVAPGAEGSYPLLVPLTPEVAEDCAVTVLRASFADSALELDEPLAIGRLSQGAEFRDVWQRTIDLTRVELENRSAYPIDALLRARFREPKKAESLLRYRLEAGERRVVAIEELPAGRGTWIGARVTHLELVDVSAVVDDGAELAAALFREAYGRWVALPPDTPALGARYALSRSIGDARLEARGAFVLRTDGTLELEPDPGEGDEATAAARAALEDALAYARRPSADEVLAATEVALLAWGETSIVRLRNAVYRDGQKDLHVWIEGGRIVAESLTPEAPAWMLTLRDEGQGYVVNASVLPTTFQARPQETVRLGYARVGELVLPSTWEEEFFLESYPQGAKHGRLTLSDWAPGVEAGALAASTPPTGELADLLRAAWDAPYRYPDEARVLRGRFRLDNPGNDDLWRGHSKVEGRFELEGFRGTRWSRWAVEVEGSKLGDEERRALGAVIEDRLRLFAWRDFGGREPFERTFRGATLERDGDAIAVRGASVERVELEGGRPARLLLAGGARRAIEWKRHGKRWLPTRIATDGEELRYAWTDLGDGWSWPKEVEMIGVFVDWGPERIRFSKLELD